MTAASGDLWLWLAVMARYPLFTLAVAVSLVACLMLAVRGRTGDGEKPRPHAGWD